MKTSYQTGLYGEEIAKTYLLAKGYEFIATRYKTKYGELDLVMQKDNIVVFVEVKSRNNPIHEEFLSAAQMRRNSNAGLVFISENPQFAKYDLRFDYIIIINNEISQHIENVWYQDS